MRELNYNDPQEKTLCDHIILCYRLKRGTLLSGQITFGKDKEFYEWGAVNKLWTRRNGLIRVRFQVKSYQEIAWCKVSNATGDTLVKFIVPLEDYQNWGK